MVLSDDEEVEEEEQETDHSMKTSSTVTSVGRSGVAAVAGSHNDDVVNLLDSPPPPRRNMSAGAAHRPADAVPVFKRARSLEEDDDHDSQQRRLSAAGLVFTSFSLLSAASISSKDKVHMKARDTLQQHFQPICAKVCRSLHPLFYVFPEPFIGACCRLPAWTHAAIIRSYR